MSSNGVCIDVINQHRYHSAPEGEKHMDAAAQLALMAKAENVFGNDQTFLSFPVMPLRFTKEQLHFATDQDLQHQQAFSSLVNLLPSGEAWTLTEPRYLWDVYEDALNADFASSARTPAEDSDYQKALQYLRLVHEDGTLEDTPFVRAYKQYNDAWILATQAYNAAKETATYTSDATEKQHWQTVDEPALRAEIVSWETRWVSEGYKNEVEAARSTVFELGARSPMATRESWKALMIKEIDTITNVTDLASAFVTSFAPINALDDGSWQPFTLTSDEVRSLVREAPTDIQTRFAIDSNDIAIASIAFEFSSAVIVRPWFVSDLFKARFWRFSDGSKVLSDGAVPPTGLCTAYVTALVFARHVTVKEKQPRANEQQIPFGGFQFPPDVRLRVSPIQRARNPLTGIVPTGRPLPIASPPTPPEPRRGAGFPAVVAEPQGGSAAASTTVSLSRLPIRRVQRMSFERIIVRRPQQPAASPAPSRAAPVDEHISILAFICKQLPQCPNPDPNVQW